MHTRHPDDPVQDRFRGFGTVIVFVLAFLAALAISDYVDFGIATILGTSQDAISGAVVLGASIVFLGAIGAYLGMLGSRIRSYSMLRDEVEEARRNITEGLDHAARIKGHSLSSKKIG